jgi:hypothetical protein
MRLPLSSLRIFLGLDWPLARQLPFQIPQVPPVLLQIGRHAVLRFFPASWGFELPHSAGLAPAGSAVLHTLGACLHNSHGWHAT